MGAHSTVFRQGTVAPRRKLAASAQEEEEEEKSYGKSRREGAAECSIPAASMTDAEAQSAPPSAPVEDKPQVERKVIGGSSKVISKEHNCMFLLF